MTKTWGVGATALRAVETAVRAGVRFAWGGIEGLVSAVLGSTGGAPPTVGSESGASRVPMLPAGPPGATPPPGGAGHEEAAAPAASAPLSSVWVSPQNRAVLLARDPHSLFVHWEIHPVRRIETLRAMGADGETAREVLRVFEIDTMPPYWQDVEIDPGAERAYAGVDPGRSYRVEVGLRTASGRFVALATSNTVTTPPVEPSPDTAVHWVVLEQGQPPRQAAAPETWTGQRVETPATATDLHEGDDLGEEPPEPLVTTPVGSSEQLPPGPPPVGSSELLPPGPPPRRKAVPARQRASDALPLR
jgi:hypothetical protein